jgi:uncharacterized phage infection (PIP) family protein YhgE
MLRMDLVDDNFSIYLDNYKNQFIAEGVNSSQQNKSLLENAQTQINSFLSQLTIEKQKLISGNENLERKIRKRNQIIDLAKKKNTELESEQSRLVNSDLGAIKQNHNFTRVYSKDFLQLILKMCLVVLIIIFLYIKDDVFQSIRSRFPTKVKTI